MVEDYINICCMTMIVYITISLGLMHSIHFGINFSSTSRFLMYSDRMDKCLIAS